MSEQLNRIESKIDRNEIKIDKLQDTVIDELSKVSRLEESVSWLKGHVKVSLTVAITLIGALVGAYLKIITNN